MGLVAELRRRNVLRMAVLYIVAAWLVMQVAGVLMDLGGLPAAAGPWLLAVLVIGFPIALFFSWFYELTPEGLALEKDVPEAASITHVTGRRMDFIVIAVLSAGLILFAGDKWWPRDPLELSIAVLPFDNMSADPNQEYFSDGISEELLNLLSQNPELTVISRSSAFAFKGKDISIPEIASQLNVAHVLEGSVRKSGNRVRITAQLIQARSDKHVWSDSYDRELRDIFAVQKEIAKAISDALNVALMVSGGETYRNAQKSTENLEAYENYLRGQYLWQRRGEENIRQAIHLFEKATKLDPKFARAWSSMAAAYMTLYPRVEHVEHNDPAYLGKADDLLLEARSAAKRALQLDDTLAEAHAALGDLAKGNREWLEAERHYLRAIGSEPNSSTAHLWYAEFLADVGRSRDALDECLIAYKLDPVHIGTHNVITSIYWQLSDTENAMKYGAAARELGVEGAFGLRIQALGNLRSGRLDTAIAFAEEHSKLQVQLGYPVGLIRLYVEAKIDPAKTNLYLETLEEHGKEFGILKVLTGYVEFGRIDEAYRAAEEHLNQLILLRWFLWNPELTTFRQDQRFASLLAKLGLLDYYRDNGWPDLCWQDDESVKCR